MPLIHLGKMIGIMLPQYRVIIGKMPSDFSTLYCLDCDAVVFGFRLSPPAVLPALPAGPLRGGQGLRPAPTWGSAPRPRASRPGFTRRYAPRLGKIKGFDWLREKVILPHEN